MIYIIIFQSVVILTLVALHFHRESSFQRRQVHSPVIEDKENVFKKTSEIFGPNHRNNFRVSLNEINCSIKVYYKHHIQVKL